MSIEQWVTTGATIGAVLIGIMRNEIAISTLDRNVNKRIDMMQETILRIMDARFDAMQQGLCT